MKSSSNSLDCRKAGLNLWTLITLGWLLGLLFLYPNPFIFPTNSNTSFMGQPRGSPGGWQLLCLFWWWCIQCMWLHLLAIWWPLGKEGPRRRNMCVPAAAAKSLQSCPTLCDCLDGRPPGSSVPGILQARILEQVAISFPNACMHAKLFQSCVTLCDPMDSSPLGSSVHVIL